MKPIRFGIIGCGLMGREFASAAARWCHLPEMDVRPEIVAVCDTNPARASLVHGAFPLDPPGDRRLPRRCWPTRRWMPCTVPCRTICTARSTARPSRPASTCMGEKPFGIDRAGQRGDPGLPGRASAGVRAMLVGVPLLSGRAADRADDRSRRLRPDHRGQRRLPALQRSRPRTSRSTGSGWSSSTASTAAWATWACTSATCRSAPAGCRGPCGRCCRTSSTSARTAAAASAPCETWDNATLLCDAADPARRRPFPMTLKTQRIAPGEKNTWYLEVLGTRGLGAVLDEESQAAGSAGVHRRRADLGPDRHGPRDGLQEHHRRDLRVRLLRRDPADVGRVPARTGARPAAGPVRRLRRAEETALSHRLFTAALESHGKAAVFAV